MRTLEAYRVTDQWLLPGRASDALHGRGPYRGKLKIRVKSGHKGILGTKVPFAAMACLHVPVPQRLDAGSAADKLYLSVRKWIRR
jgi:hypothetical protein